MKKVQRDLKRINKELSTDYFTKHKGLKTIKL
jgi:hypothetical protein